MDVLRNIATQTHGKFYRAETSEQLLADFIDIANYLKYAAGVDSQLAMDFTNVDVDGNATANYDSQVFSYVPYGTPYTLHTDGISRDAVLGRTRIMWPNGTNSVRDQSAEWNTNHNLAFSDVGVVNITERWNATFRIKIKQTGNIDLFNCTTSPSILSYKEPYGAFKQFDLCLPSLTLRVNTPTSTESGDLDVSGLTPQSGDYTSSVPLHWNLKYKADWI